MKNNIFIKRTALLLFTLLVLSFIAIIYIDLVQPSQSALTSSDTLFQYIDPVQPSQSALTSSDTLFQLTAGQTLYLTKVMINNEIYPPYIEGQKIIVRSTTSVTVDDGCNTWRYPGINDNYGKPEPNEGSPFWSYYFLQTLRGCASGPISAGSSEFGKAMYSVSSYELKEGDVWLYFGVDRENALVFQEGEIAD